MRRLLILQGVFCSLIFAAAALGQEARLPLKLRVSAGSADRTDAAASLALPEALRQSKSLRLVTTGGDKGALVPVQLDAEGNRLWWVVEGLLKAGQTRTYRLEAGEPVAGGAVVEVKDSAAAVEALISGRTVLRYNKIHVQPPEGVDPRYGRSGHLHPLWSPSGAIVTDELPPDHLHQSGVFLAYTRSKFEDRNVDFWNLAGGKGRVRFKSLKAATSGPVFGEFQTEHEHVDLMAEENKSELGAVTGGKVALNETWRVRIWCSGLKSGYWLMDIDSTQACATESPLVLPEYHYGGMAIRAARGWTPGEVTFLTSEGDERIKGNHTRPKWCDIRGSVEGKAAGIAAMTHPGNFRFPEPLRIHPTMPYMVYTPQVLGEWKIEPGRAHHARYRWVVHDGQLTADDLNRLWADFAEPLAATIE
jgi:hypothetical protein